MGLKHILMVANDLLGVRIVFLWCLHTLWLGYLVFDREPWDHPPKGVGDRIDLMSIGCLVATCS